VIPELPELNSGFASCYPKFPNKIPVSGISGSGSGIPGSGFGLRVFCPALSRGLQAFARERERERESRATTLPYEGPGPSFYRCKERVQVYNGGVAIC
jgi:hypothetical protein